MNYAAFDIETVGQPMTEEMKDRLSQFCQDMNAPGNIKDPKKIEAWRDKKYNDQVDKRGLHPVTGQVIVANIAYRDTATEKPWEFVTDQASTEIELLEAIDARMVALKPQRIYTFNGQKFDLWFLMWRFAANGYTPQFHWPFTRNNAMHCDMLDHTGFGKGSLDFWLSEVIGEGKIGNGSQIQEWYDAGEMDKILEYSQDEMVKLTRFIDACGIAFQGGWPERFYS